LHPYRLTLEPWRIRNGVKIKKPYEHICGTRWKTEAVVGNEEKDRKLEHLEGERRKK